MSAARQQSAQASISEGALPSLTMRSPRAATARTRSAAMDACSGVFDAATQASAAARRAASARSSDESRNVEARCRAASRSDELGGKRRREAARDVQGRGGDGRVPVAYIFDAHISQELVMRRRCLRSPGPSSGSVVHRRRRYALTQISEVATLRSLISKEGK